MPIPVYMVFPRLFVSMIYIDFCNSFDEEYTCATVAARTFKIEFEINLVVMLDDGHLITENFPIKLIRAGLVGGKKDTPLK